MLGIVACETLYEELERTTPEATVAFVPQWLHEYPLHPPESSAIHRAIADGIEELEEKGVDDILVLYHDPEGLKGIESASVPLHVYRGGDCIDLFLSRSSTNRFDEWKAPGTYYLTRGWIDVGLDCYKVYKAYAGELDSLIETFTEAQRRYPGLRVTWPGSDRIRRASERSEGMLVDPADLLRRVVACFRRVVLVDTGALLPFHHEYAEAFRSFVADVRSNGGAPADVDLSVIEGDRTTFEALVRDPRSVPEVRTVPPNTPLTSADVGVLF